MASEENCLLHLKRCCCFKALDFRFNHVKRKKRGFTYDSFQFQSLCSMKYSSKALQNLSYFWNTIIHVVFFFVSWPILKYFAGTFSQDQTLKMGGVISTYVEYLMGITKKLE